VGFLFLKKEGSREITLLITTPGKKKEPRPHQKGGKEKEKRKKNVKKTFRKGAT